MNDASFFGLFVSMCRTNCHCPKLMSELSCFEVEFQFMFDKLAIKVGPIIFLEIRFDNTSKVTYPNYYKKYAYTLAHSMTFMCFCLF
jgi:hypothetical protein